LDQIGDVSGMVFTLDALHTQDDTARLIASRQADWVLTVKANQKGLLASCQAQPWDTARPSVHTVKGHGRTARWETRCLPPDEWVCFPGAAQIARIVRTRKTTRRAAAETCHVVTSVPAGLAGPAQIAAWVQGHWTIENQLHWTRDVVYDEDRSQARRGHAPRNMASLRNTAPSALRLTGVTAIARTQRHLSDRTGLIAKIIGLPTPQPT
jgi:predicted transposase YbfD/YdcC